MRWSKDETYPSKVRSCSDCGSPYLAAMWLTVGVADVGLGAASCSSLIKPGCCVDLVLAS